MREQWQTEYFDYTAEQWLALAEQLEAEAKAADQRVEDSWRRSDTDGFLSQWAGQLTARLKREQANIARAHGKSEFIGLYEGERRVNAKRVMVRDKYTFSKKPMWVVDDGDPVAKKRKWIPYGEKSRVQKQLGLSEQPETDWAWAHITGEGKGLSGNAWVATYRVKAEW
jgi:hypothetical protein